MKTEPTTKHEATMELPPELEKVRLAVANGLARRGFEKTDSRQGYAVYVREAGVPVRYWLGIRLSNAGRLFVGDAKPGIELTGTPLYQAILKDGLRK